MSVFFERYKLNESIRLEALCADGTNYVLLTFFMTHAGRDELAKVVNFFYL